MQYKGASLKRVLNNCPTSATGFTASTVAMRLLAVGKQSIQNGRIASAFKQRT